MSSTIDNEYENFCGKLTEIHLKLKDSWIRDCIKFNKEWQMKILGNEKIEQDLEMWEKEFAQTYPKIKRKSKKCIFFGETSCGKSTLINAILQSDVLPEGSACISTCFVEIQSIPPNRQGNISYLVVDGEEREFALLSRYNNLRSEGHLKSGSHIDLFYNSENCAMLRNDAILVDTPGIDEDTKTDENVVIHCNDADLIIVMVNSTASLNNTIKRFIDRLRQCFTKLNLAIVYNLWDILDNRRDREDAKLQFINRAKEVLCGQLDKEANDKLDKEANERIHFLSAYERILVNRNDEELQWIRRWQSRNEAFDQFNAFLQRQMDESAFTKRYHYLLHLQNRLAPILDQCHFVVTKMSNKIPEQFLRIKDKFHDIKELEEEIKKSTASIFLLAYNRFIEEALKIIKNEKTSQNKDEYKSLLGESDENESLDDKLKDLLEDIIEKGKEDLKEKIKDCIKRTNDEFLAERILFIEQIYFPLYLDELTVEYGADFVEIFNTIVQKIKVSTGVTIGLTALVGAAIVATGGVAAAILVPVEIAVGTIVGIGAGGAAVGATIGTGTSTPIIIGNKTPFQFIWNKDAYPIRSAWEKLEEELCSSYGRFLNELNFHLEIRISSLNVELSDIQKDFDNI